MSIGIKGGKIQFNTTLGPVKKILLGRCNCCCKCDAQYPNREKPLYGQMVVSGLKDFSFELPDNILYLNNGTTESWYENVTITSSGFAALNGTYVIQIKGNAGTCDAPTYSSYLSNAAIDFQGTRKIRLISSGAITTYDIYGGISVPYQVYLNTVSAVYYPFINQGGGSSTNYGYYRLNGGSNTNFTYNEGFQVGGTHGLVRNGTSWWQVAKAANSWYESLLESASNDNPTFRLVPPTSLSEIGNCTEIDERYVQYLTLYCGLGFQLTPPFISGATLNNGKYLLRKTVGTVRYKWRLLSATQANDLLVTESGDQRIDEAGNDRATE